AFGGRGGEGVGVPGVQQALEDDPPLADVVVAGQVHPAEPAVRQAPEDLVLAADHLARPELRRERERVPAVAAEPLGPAGTPAPAPAHLLVAPAAVAAV